MVSRVRATAILCIAALVVSGAAGCSNAPKTALERWSEARQLAADLLVQFIRAGDAANRAVMADTDESSVAFRREAEQATQAVQRDTDALGSILLGLGYSEERRLLEEFSSRFTEYRALDRTILEMAVENTNLKAQRLSFGEAQEAADALRSSLEAVESSAPENNWRVRALVATAVAAVREIQVLQAPHIADPDEGAMTRMEKRMGAAEATARNALQQLAGLVRPASHAQLGAATEALERFRSVNNEIITLSRRNTNVHSLSLSLGRKRQLAAACEDSLRALQEALAGRGFTGTR